MQLVPEWAPNIHPMIIHFPLVLLIFAVLFDFVGFFLSRSDWIRKSALLLYALGTIAAVVAFITGNSASDSIEIPSIAFPAINAHADWAEITLWFFIIYTTVRLSVGIFFKSLKKVYILPIILVGFLGIYFLYQTGDHGAQLVFGYGLETGNILKSEQVNNETVNDTKVSDSTFTVSENSSWKLIADAGVIKILTEKFKWVEGSPNELNPMLDQDELVLMFHLGNEVHSGGFVYDNKIKSVQITAEINIDDLNGELEIIHHFIDSNNYDFLGIGNGKISLSRKINGEIKIFEEDKYTGNGWIEIRLVADGSHFRGYVNNKMIVHGHGSEPNPGSVGMKISGKGSTSIKIIYAESLIN